MPITIRIGLKEDGIRSILQGIDGDGKGFSKVRKI